MKNSKPAAKIAWYRGNVELKLGMLYCYCILQNFIIIINLIFFTVFLLIIRCLLLIGFMIKAKFHKYAFIKKNFIPNGINVYIKDT